MNNIKFLLLLVLSTVAFQVKAKSFTLDNIKYEVVKASDEKKYFDNVVRVNNGKKARGVVRIPSSVEYEGKIYYVEGITNSAFRDNKDIEEVVIPSSVWLININCFRDCSNLKKVTFEDSMLECKYLRIVWGAFAKCTNLKDIILPNKRTDIFGDADISYSLMPFQDCSNIENVILPDSLLHDSNGNNYFKGAFKGCKKIKSVRRYTKSPVFASTMFDSDCVWSIESYPKIKNLNDQQCVAYLNGNEIITEQAFATHSASDSMPNFIPLSGSIQSNRSEATITSTSPKKISEVDNKIPNSGKTDNNNKFAIILANENYKREEHVKYAINDGETLRKYLTNTLGYNPDNIMLQTDATLNDINYALDWIEQVGKAYDGDISILFYYSGHGFPNEASKEAYLLPVDGFAANSATAYSLNNLYTKLQNVPSKQTIVLLDCCFSGAQRSDKMMNSSRGVRLKPKKSFIGGNMVVFSASSSDETAYCYEEENHGLFTYFLLKKLQESKGDTNLGELSDYIKSQVGRISIVKYKKSQTPMINPSNLLQDWKNLTF